MIECKIGPKGDIDIKNLLDKQHWSGKHYLAKHGVPKLTFLDKCHFQTYFLPHKLEIGDTFLSGIAKQPTTKRWFMVTAFDDNSILFKEVMRDE